MSSVHGTVEALRIALAALRANTARGVLTTLGIIIGILAVVTTMTAANGLSNSFRESASVIGADVLFVSRTPWIMMGRFFQFRNRPNLTLKEADKLERQLHSAIAVNPSSDTQRSVKFGSEVRDNIRIIGTTHKHMLVSSALPEQGRFFNAYDVQFSRRVCVIGKTIHEQVFESRDPVNKTLKIGRHDFQVIGVMEKQGSGGTFGGPDFDSQVFVPVTTFVKLYGGFNRNFDFAVKAPAGAPLDDYEFEVIGEMRKIRRLKPDQEDNFAINKMDSLLDAFDDVMRVVLLVGLAITGISLFVGGVGVMNIMFVSVTERTKEIGIRKAIGAKRRAILSQFLFESSVICLIGGAIGIVLSFGAAAAIDRFVMPASVSLPIVGVALCVSVMVGVVSGFIPAWRASRLNPIDALHYE
ncbi:MAG TPA: ABC transporter permease [Thermoanaerobaculales bacterium]|nr:ABC transporter permease [Thermoanaerobaculales bacterium]HPA81507.1 ABC transporter permease [Thermoanaerobaculales bacterium]HQL30261.1 ABC transporter permease [Thermoanaerobaculales bacterium]HQN97084.1 ABC transporter permease [Thermoanaerobaculales bacterium]HQP42455.1 ABC transporter permease [Thermoanaerobaculales bacterium]